MPGFIAMLRSGVGVRFLLPEALSPGAGEQEKVDVPI
jgi:hypothetical protein